MRRTFARSIDLDKPFLDNFRDEHTVLMRGIGAESEDAGFSTGAVLGFAALGLAVGAIGGYAYRDMNPPAENDFQSRSYASLSPSGPHPMVHASRNERPTEYLPLVKRDRIHDQYDRHMGRQETWNAISDAKMATHGRRFRSRAEAQLALDKNYAMTMGDHLEADDWVSGRIS